MFTWTWTWTWTAMVVCLFSNTLTSALHCDWLRHYSHRSNVCLTLLEHMGGQLIEKDGPVLFPYKLYRRIRNTEVECQVVFIRDSLEHIFHLYYHGNRSSVTWDTVKTQNFMEGLHSQINKLNGCVSTNNRTDYSLRKYYKRLSKIGSSAESWELIRRHTKEHLDQLELLVNSITAQEGALQGDGKRQDHASRGRSGTMTTTTTTTTTPLLTLPVKRTVQDS